MLTHLRACMADRCGVGVRNVALSQILSRAECTVHRHRFGPHGQPTESDFLRRRILMLMNMREIVRPAAQCCLCAAGGSPRVSSQMRDSQHPDFCTFSLVPQS